MAMRFRAHETFCVRKGWLSKGMRTIRERPDLFVSSAENPIDVLGIGSNMVKSLRYWLQAVGLTEEVRENRKMVQHLTPLGGLVWEQDRYTEELGTLFLLHYRLISNRDFATAWYAFFNTFAMGEFTREDFVEFLQRWIRMESGEETVAARSLQDDFACILNTYLPRARSGACRSDPENNIECPFTELGLVDVVSREKKTYRKTAPPADLIPPWVTLAVVADRANGRREITLNELLASPCGLGRTFNLDSTGMLDVLYAAERTGAIRINRTAGLDVVLILQNITFLSCADMYYRNLNETEQAVFV